MQRPEGFRVAGFLVFPNEKVSGSVHFLVDTGASQTTMSYLDALRLGLHYESGTIVKLATAGGIINAFTIGPVSITIPTDDGSFRRINLPSILILDERREHIPSLLGMDVLRGFRIVLGKNQGKLFLHTPGRKPLLRGKRRCFLSYNHKDRQFVRRLANDLKRRSFDVWFDEWKVKPGDSITTSIQDGLRLNRNFVLVMTPNSMRSPWVRRELATKLYEFNSQRNHRTKVIPLLRKDCSIPVWLKDIRYLDFRHRYQSAFDELVRSISRL